MENDAEDSDEPVSDEIINLGEDEDDYKKMRRESNFF